MPLTNDKLQQSAIVIPPHLPDKLAICFYTWAWIFEDAYADLDQALRKTKERGFNCVRVDTGALLTHDQAVSDPIGQRHEEILIDIAIRDGYWGIMATASMSPYMPYWNDPEVVKWLKRVNGRILG